MAYTPTISVLLAACLGACAAPSSSESPAPREGHWAGERVSFDLVGGALSTVEVGHLSCDGTLGESACSFAVSRTLSGPFALGSGSAAPITVVAEGIALTGRFTSPNAASGTLVAEDPEGCCTAKGVWSASLVAPWVETGADAVGSDALAPDVNGGDAGGSGPDAPDGASAPQVSALEDLNGLRAHVGAAPVTMDGAINAAASAHCAFYVQHHTQYQATNLSPHSEDPSFGAGFTGVSFADRMQAAGFTGPASTETMAFVASPKDAMQGWLATVYHRLPLLDPRTVAFGYGLASGPVGCDTADWSARTAQAGDPVVIYPIDGQIDVPRAWNGLEGPQPPPPPEGFPSGSVISARLDGPPKITSHALRDDKGNEVPHVFLDAQGDATLGQFDARTVVLYAHAPLAAKTTYHVELKGTAGPSALDLSWSFTTGP